MSGPTLEGEKKNDPENDTELNLMSETLGDAGTNLKRSLSNHSENSELTNAVKCFLGLQITPHQFNRRGGYLNKGSRDGRARGKSVLRSAQL